MQMIPDDPKRLIDWPIVIGIIRSMMVYPCTQPLNMDAANLKMIAENCYNQALKAIGYNLVLLEDGWRPVQYDPPPEETRVEVCWTNKRDETDVCIEAVMGIGSFINNPKYPWVIHALRCERYQQPDEIPGWNPDYWRPIKVEV